MNMRRIILMWTMWLICTLGLAGCYVGERFVAGEPFSEQALTGLEQGTLTRQDVLQWFGPPVAVARRGSTMTYPPAGIRNEGWQDIGSDTFFELFPQNDGHADGRIIYYYRAPRVATDGVLSILIAGGYTRRIVTDELWILIDERTGAVKAFILRTGERTSPPSGGNEPRSLPQSLQVGNP